MEGPEAEGQMYEGRRGGQLGKGQGLEGQDEHQTSNISLMTSILVRIV